MNNFSFYSPTCFVFGKDSESQTGSLVRRFGGSKVLIHYGGGSAIDSSTQRSFSLLQHGASPEIRSVR